MQRSLKALSALLTYPTPELRQAAGELSETLEKETLLPFGVRQQLHRLLTEFATDDLYDLQERYVLLFDRTRSLSLHLFEHVHGENRDRGQAMIEDMYQVMAIANYEDRFVIPTAHRETTEDAYDLRGSCGFSFGNGCSGGASETNLFGTPKRAKTPMEVA